MLELVSFMVIKLGKPFIQKKFGKVGLLMICRLPFPVSTIKGTSPMAPLVTDVRAWLLLAPPLDAETTCQPPAALRCSSAARSTMPKLFG
jgi:hypothetical protein